MSVKNKAKRKKYYDFRFEARFDFEDLNELADTLRAIAKEIDNREGGIGTIPGRSYEGNGPVSFSGGWSCFDKEARPTLAATDEVLHQIGRLVTELVGSLPAPAH